MQIQLRLLLTAAMTNCCVRVAGNSIFINFVHSGGKYSAILAATRHGGETLCNSARDRRKIVKIIKNRKEKMILFRKYKT